MSRVPSFAIHFALAVIVLHGAASSASTIEDGAGDLRAALQEARRSYDREAALEVLAGVRAEAPQDRLLLAEASLLVAELYRIEFEQTPESERPERRRLGDLIDEPAREGLDAVDSLLEAEGPTSTALRLRADLLGTLIRSKYRGQKHRGAMNRAARQAIELDPENALARVSLAKPLLFAPGRSEQDVREAVDLLDEALSLEPTLEPALLLRGRARAELGDLESAAEDWRAALRANPDCAPARELLEEHGL